MNIKVYGAKAWWCQVSRIIEGFIGLGHTPVLDNNYDFIYANNPPFDKGDEQFKEPPISLDGFKIFNVLDIPEHDKNYDLSKLKYEISDANIVTCISYATQKQLKKLINVDAHVIWNPIKDVFCDRMTEKDIDFLYVGRANDNNKRFHLLRLLSIENFYVVGNDNPTFGKYLGPLTNSQLNSIYNRSKFLLFPSKFEGLGLPMLEALASGTIPIVCNDNPNSYLCPDFCICEPCPEDILNRVNSIKEDYNFYRQIILNEYTYDIQRKFSKFQIAKNIINLYENYYK